MIRRLAHGLRCAAPLLFLCAIIACAVTTKPVHIKEGKKYGVTRGLIWRPTWWNYYERGVSYAEGEYWQDAIEDLREAILLREADQRRARSYGMHFLDYFPHRELGIIYYRQERYTEAIEELELSLATVESAKAEYFLNKSRKAWLERSGADRAPPVIEISRPLDGLLTQELSLLVEGVIWDDQYAFGVSINGISIPVFLSSREIPFSKQLSLNPGVNRLEIVAKDLVGKKASREISVIVDRAGPVLFLEPPRVLARRAAGLTLLVAGEARDGLGLSRVVVNGVPIDEPAGRNCPFESVLEIPPWQRVVEVEAEDLVGNVTHGSFMIPGEAPKQETACLQLACMERSVTDAYHLLPPPSPERGSQGGLPGLWYGGPQAKADEARMKEGSQGPSELSLHLKDLPDTLTVYYESLYIEGSATGPFPIQSLEFNGEQLLERQGHHIFFSYLADLKKGDNIIQIEASDTHGYRARKNISVERKTPKILSLSGRMRLSLIPFQPDECSIENADLVTEDLLMALIQQGRFHMVERARLDDVLDELELASSRLAEEKTAVRVGRLLAAEGSIVGGVFETPEAIEVVARVVDTETSHVLLTKDAFSEDKSLESIRSMMDGLAYKLRQGLPLLEGDVLRCEKNCFYLNIGRDQGARPEQKVLFFREGPEIRHPVTQMFLGREWAVVSEGRIKEVFEDISAAIPVEKKSAGGIRPADRVMTK